MHKVCKVTVVGFLLSCLLARFALSDEKACSKGEKCGTGEKVAKLLTSWKAVAEEEKTGCPEERAKVVAELASVAKSCPMGSRMAETLGFVKGVLAVSFGERAACEKASPQAQAGAETRADATAEATAKASPKEAKEESACELSKVMTARASLGRDLHHLVSFALAAVPGSACCEKAGAEACKKDEKGGAVATTTPTSVAAVASAAPAGKSACCEGAAGICCKDLMAKAQALKTSWDKVGGEFASMCPVKKQELFASMKSLGGRSKVVTLLPESVMALAEGVEALEAMDSKVEEYAKAHADQLKNVPDEEKKCFAEQSKLIHEAGEVLRRVRAAAAATHGGAPSEKKAGESVSG